MIGRGYISHPSRVRQPADLVNPKHAAFVVVSVVAEGPEKTKTFFPVVYLPWNIKHYHRNMAEVEVNLCSNPGCGQPGTSSCSACKTTVYCGVNCQTADWPSHKEECDGHLRKVGKANLAKAKLFDRESKWMQALRYANIAATKLKQLKDRRLETVELIGDALLCKYNALNFMYRPREAMECIKECYTLWAMNHLRNPGSIKAALGLIQSCLHNKEYEDAEHYARHAMFMINDMADNFIPSDRRSMFLADGSYWLARAILNLAETGSIPPGEKKKAGVEAIELARQALELHTQLSGAESAQIACDMVVLGDILGYFNDVDDDEIPRLFEQAIAIISRVEGSSSVNVAVAKMKLGTAYVNRADGTLAVRDLDRCLANMELALPHYREAARIFRVNNHADNANDALKDIARVEENIRQVRATATRS